MIKKRCVAGLITSTQQQLQSYYDDEELSRQYAWWTVEAISGKTKEKLILAQTISFTDEQERQYHQWIDQIVNHHMPIQYMIGSVPFCDTTILVEPPTLIPRPETEEWCMRLINQLKKLPPQPLTILDLCCGSGCIAIALAHALPHATIYATDISPIALALTKKNIKHNKITNITTHLSDLFTKISNHKKFDIIVSNPPYITPAEWPKLDISVAQWEDKAALVAQQNGLALIKKIIITAPYFLAYNNTLHEASIPQLLIEIGHMQGKAVHDLMEKSNYTDIRIEKDLAQRDRVATGRINYVDSSKL